MADDGSGALAPTAMVDADHPDVRAFAREAAAGAVGERERAVRLAQAVRDGLRYDPYHIDLSVDGMKASRTLAARRGWCVPKATLLAACCRAQGLAARLGYADVRNHLSTGRLRETMGDLYVWHGYVSIRIDGRWVKATPAFDQALCDRFGLKPLAFDGVQDSIFHAFDRSGARHMEYVHERGEFDDVPLERIRADFRLHYPNAAKLAGADWDADVAKEQAGG